MVVKYYDNVVKIFTYFFFDNSQNYSFQPSSPTFSPKKFANQGLVYLSEINSVEDLQELSAKQMKDMLAMNRVNFKGVVEKQELFKIVERVWRQHVKSTEGKEIFVF